MSEGVIIAIDGPGGSGKSTVAKAVAERLGYRHLDTGAMYRAVTLLALRAGVLGDGEATAALARDMTLEIDGSVVLDGEDVTAAIRSPEVDAAVSEIAANPAVRANLVERQRAWVCGGDAAADGGGAVVEGRDIGSVVFPGARLKIFLTADPAERARRRLEQFEPWGREAGSSSAGETAEALSRRDDLDSSRTASPLKVADGAIVVDSTGRSVEDVLEEVLSHL
ncbi:MAG TPA: (d)CMP kinase [Acidimicrobiales bacterium]|nr:(d)CMP kinase [Acidimicrobiales bacterium]